MTRFKSILLVEDDADDQLYFQDAIHEIGQSLHCRVASNGREALTQMEVLPPPDLIFMDLNMPVMNGYECLAAIKKEDRFKHIPVIIFTTSKNINDIEKTQQLGANLYMTKPSDFSLLCAKLLKVLHLDFSNLQFVMHS
jgi:CheY-like chemotaxis protein